ncbi:biosynthetic arginine decarboxylase [Pleionea litopenaei]|uniref:Arginine decarboxylase n=1 Tax=Pleionea litopenaei TaxID=3070815 RepID=A0AA51RRB2_9GAMM|nr:biosynthetic arginine decarboxylase [Pleionea sp. HL-JVS1]WMS86117.1 biosynthetic arginine decarboxylase [Pleionea sp. HL-JVS1]
MTNQSDSALDNYNVPLWSDGFFNIDKDGDLVLVSQHRGDDVSHKLHTIVEKLKTDEKPLPVLIRFGNILRDRLDQITGAFADAIEQNSYQNKFTCVYPIKVNQQREVVNELVQHGGERFGLEAGSKPELLAVLGTDMPRQSVVVCNGYKDREYIRTALIGQQMGRRVYIVVEKLHELELVIEEAKRMNIEPTLGVRVRMYAISKGNWQDTGGEKSKFGLSPSQLIKLTEMLAEHNMTHCLQFLHCHLGSQISSITDIRKGVKECARYFVELKRMGLPLRVIDVGGGLGVDYEGTQSPSYYSINYTVQEYANTIVQTVIDVLDQHKLEHPEIITESGRALTAHHAVLVTNMFDREKAPGLSEPEPVLDSDANVLQNLWRHYQTVDEESASEAFHSGVFYLNEALMLYTHEAISLEEWARAEQLYFAICRKIYPLLNPEIPGNQDILRELDTKLADKLFCNFSLFQSLPDAWGVGQIFPVIPLSGLNRPLTYRGVIKDITCDSDGRIERYVNGNALESSLRLPEIEDDQPLTLGIFMVGAYQEILGALHNLFGDTHTVHINLAADGSIEEIEQNPGDTVSEALSIVHFDSSNLEKRYAQQLQESQLSTQQVEEYLTELSSGLSGYTYLED